MTPIRDAPAFDFYPERWLVGVASFTDAEQIAYLRLLCHQWLLGDAGLQDDIAALRRLAGKGVTPALLEKFPLGADARRRNARLEIVREAQRSRIQEASRKGRRMAEGRWKDKRHAALETAAQAAATPALGAKGLRSTDDPADARALPEDSPGDADADACALLKQSMGHAHHPPPTTHPNLRASVPPGGGGGSSSDNGQVEGEGERQAEAEDGAQDPGEKKSAVRPTLDQARATAPQIGITPDEAESWWTAREAAGWMRSSNGAVMPVGDNWQADAKTYTNNVHERRRRQPALHSRNDGANKAGRYA